MAEETKVAADAAPKEKTSVTLIEPIQFGEEKITTLEWRKPTGADIVNCGLPVKINFSTDPPEVTYDEKKMAAMMATLYRQPPSVISKLDPRDWFTAAMAIERFFYPDFNQLI